MVVVHLALAAPPLQSRCRVAARLAARLARLTVQYATSLLAQNQPSIRIKHGQKCSRSCPYSIYQQQLAIKQQARQSTNDLTRESSTDEAPSKAIVEALALCNLVDHLTLLITSTTSTTRQEQLNEIMDICIADLRQTTRDHSHRNHTHRGSDTLAANPWNDKSTIAPCAIRVTTR